MIGRRLIRIGTTLTLVWAASAAFAPREAARGAGPAPDEALLRAEVATLASPEFGGRSGEGGRKAAAHLVAAFTRLKLEPLFEGGYLQAIPGEMPGTAVGQNVGACLRGSDPSVRDDWVIVSAHYDHLGVRNGVLFPGADDNASGVAMMIEVARALKEGPEGPRRSIMFLGFDLEEAGLFGSRYFIEHSPVPLSRVKLFLTADMIGRSLGGVCGSRIFVMGTEHSPWTRPWLESSARGEPVDLGLIGSDMLVLNRSDYGPFRSRKIPYLFFSTGENPCYHSPQDVPETLDYSKLAAVSRVILGVVRQAGDASDIPPWSPIADNPIAEAATIRDVFRTLLEHRRQLKVPPVQTLLMTNAVRSLDAIVERGEMTVEERSAMVNVARVVMMSIF